MKNVAAAALISVNTLVLSLLAAYVLAVALAEFGRPPPLLQIATVFVAAVPHAALLLGFRRAAAPWMVGLTLVLNLLWALLLLVAGAAAATGLADLTGLMLVFVPDFLLVCMNVAALVRRASPRRGRRDSGAALEP